MFDKRYYTLSHIIAMFNQMQYTSFSLSNAATSYDCIHIDSSCSVDSSQAPDIMDILYLTETEYEQGGRGTNILISLETDK